jgi:hypothetical protein
MGCKKYNKGVNLANAFSGLGQFAGIYAGAFNDPKAAKYGQIASNVGSIAQTAGKIPKNKKSDSVDVAGIATNDVYGMEFGQMMARKGMRVLKKKRKKK